MPSTRALVLVALVAFAFWEPLFAGGTLAPDDQLWLSDPFNAEPPEDLTIEIAERDAATIHGWWVGWADDVRSGDLRWWRDVGAGGPFLAEGLPVTHLAYLVVPGWYAPGLVAALTVLLAAVGTMRLADRNGLLPVAGLFAGIAYGFSGLMFVWIGWPHATAIALAPWVVTNLLALRDSTGARSILAAATPIAVQLWCGVFAIAVFTVVGAVLWFGVDMARERRWRGPVPVLAAIALGALLAAPHLWPRWERWSWADTDHLDAAGDTSAPLLTVITTVFGSGFGNESIGVQWLASGSFQLSIGFVGASTVVAAVIAVVLGRVMSGLAAFGLAGLGLAYVGGPFDRLADVIAGSGSLASHARLLLVLALALTAGSGIHALVVTEVSAATWRARGRSMRTQIVVAVAMTVVGGVAWLDLLRESRGLRAVAAHSIATVVVLAIGVMVLGLCARGRVSGAGVATIFVALVAYELLSFGMPIPTVTDRTERPVSTAAHDALRAVLGDHGRVAGDHDAFAPADASRFGIADVRAPGLRSTGEIRAFTMVDPSSVFAAVGGGPFEPVIRRRGDADPSTAPLWDTLGVDAWVLPRDAAPPGPRVDPEPEMRSPLAAASLIGSLTIPEHGLRAVVLDLVAPAYTTIDLEVAAGGVVATASTVVRNAIEGRIAVPVAGEGLPSGASARVFVTLDTDEQQAEVGTIGGVLALGTVGGVVGEELVWTEGVVIIARPTPRVRWEGPTEADISIVTELDDRVVVEVVTETSGVVRTDVIAEPGWAVLLNGATVPVAAVDDLVVGVQVPEGIHVIEFVYRPPRFGVATLFAVLALALAAIAVWRQRRRGSPAR